MTTINLGETHDSRPSKQLQLTLLRGNLKVLRPRPAVVASSYFPGRVFFVMRTLVLIDGQNLYHWEKHGWGPRHPNCSSRYDWPSYDIEKLARSLVTQTPSRKLTEVRFYSGVPDPKHGRYQAFWHGFWSNILRYLRPPRHQMGPYRQINLRRLLRSYRLSTQKYLSSSPMGNSISRVRRIDIKIASSRRANQRTPQQKSLRTQERRYATCNSDPIAPSRNSPPVR